MGMRTSTDAVFQEGERVIVFLDTTRCPEYCGGHAAGQIYGSRTIWSSGLVRPGAWTNSSRRSRRGALETCERGVCEREILCRDARVCGMVRGLLLASQVLAFVRNSSNWSYMPNPMGENWVICPDRMPGDAVQRTKDGAAAWDYEHFRFTFDPEACLSDGAFGILNGVNQIDFGRLSEGVLANTVSFFFTDAPDRTVECDMRFNNTVNWYTGTGTPPGINSTGGVSRPTKWGIALASIMRTASIPHR